MFEWLQANLLWLWIQWTYGPQMDRLYASIHGAGEL